VNDGERISDDDRRLFARAVGRVNRLRPDRVDPERPRPPPVPKQTLSDRAEVLRELLEADPAASELETGEELVFLRPGLQQRLLTRLRRGHFAVGAELDLHGLNAEQARAALAEFLRACRLQQVRCVRIVHGKGLRSPHGRPVIKQRLHRWLRLRDEVLAFCSARPTDGGTGAVYVLLKA